MARATESVWDDLLVSMLAVNNYSLEKAFAHLEGLRATGLVKPMNLTAWTREEVQNKLKSAGFDRGTFMNGLMAHRLLRLADFLQSNGIPDVESVLSGDDCSAIKNLLLRVNGIGPNMVAKFLLLRGLA